MHFPLPMVKTNTASAFHMLAWDLFSYHVCSTLICYIGTVPRVKVSTSVLLVLKTTLVSLREVYKLALQVNFFLLWVRYLGKTTTTVLGKLIKRLNREIQFQWSECTVFYHNLIHFKKQHWQRTQCSLQHSPGYEPNTWEGNFKLLENTRT